MKISLPVSLLLVFITLKLTSIIAWSWWWVLSPIWLPSTVVSFVWVLVLTFGGLVMIGIKGVAAYKDWKGKR
jgi:hypothetical protein